MDFLSATLDSVKPSPTVALTGVVADLRAQGREIIALGSGEPVFPTPENIREAGKRAIDAGKTRYTTVDGIGELKDAVSAKFQRENGLSYGADEITMWGTGQPLREFMHADDLAGALIFLMEHYSDAPHVNVGSGQEISIRGLADLVVEKAGFRGRIVQDETKPDGTPRKLMNVSKLNNAGWKAKIGFEEGIRSVYEGLKEKSWY